MTVEHLRPLLECDRALDSLHKFAHIMAQGEVPDRIEPVVRLGRLTALRKPDQQIGDQVEAATAPFQYALKTEQGQSVSLIYSATPYRLGPPRHYCLRRWDQRIRPTVEH